MKTLIILLLALAVAIPMAMADEPQNSSGSQWKNDLGWGNGLRDWTSAHNHAYQRYTPDDEFGMGVDLIVYKDKQEEKTTLLKKFLPNRVTIEAKRDFANENNSVYLVSTYDLYDLWVNR